MTLPDHGEADLTGAYGLVPQEGARILLVEDDEVLRELMERNLRARHHTVSIAADAGSALRHLRTSTFDLIILDINLPDLSGWDILRIAKRELQYPPIVVVSAVRVSPRRLGEFRPLAYLPKPFPMEALLRLAIEAAERRDGEGRLASEITNQSMSDKEDLYD